MLTGIHVRNMALLREEEIRFGEGLNILTGETGAGKSILLGSVGVALGSGSFRDYAPEEQESYVELLFETTDDQVLALMEKEGIPADDGQIIISRKYHQGRSVSRVNGENASIRFIKALSSLLLDIHGQHDSRSLLQQATHLKMLDEYASAELGSLPKQYAQAYDQMKALQHELEEAVTDEKDRLRQIDLLSFEIDEINQAQPQPGEDESLEEAFRRMSASRKILSSLQEAEAYTTGSDGAGDGISRALRVLSQVADYGEDLRDLFGQLEQIEDLLDGFGRDISACMEESAFDEETFAMTQERLNVLNRLKKKYGGSIEAVTLYRDKQQEILDQLLDYDRYLAGLQTRLKEKEAQILSLGEEISEIRRRCAGTLEKSITQALQDLHFSGAVFHIQFDRSSVPRNNGIDDVCFMICTNPGMPLRPLQDTASGGELSRIMLAVRSVMADRDAVQTLIFDEIDSGISGRTAQKVSEKMALIAKERQVICITHLAQIAAMADHHFLITKASADGLTQTHIHRLSERESVDELARILGGAVITQTVTDSACEMRQMAEAYKKSIRPD